MVSAHRLYPSEDYIMYLAGPSTTRFEEELHDALLGEEVERDDEEDVESEEDEDE